ncbi:MAG: IS1 family transposase [Dissulfurispiraceae bacterium]
MVFDYNVYMTTDAAKEKVEAKCPHCNLDAVYKYGKTWQGKQRFLCLICGRQFTHGTGRFEVRDRPSCPVCGKIMHLYKREDKVLRFRCSGYPVCKTFTKTYKEGYNELLHS